MANLYRKKKNGSRADKTRFTAIIVETLPSHVHRPAITGRRKAAVPARKSAGKAALLIGKVVRVLRHRESMTPGFAIGADTPAGRAAIWSIAIAYSQMPDLWPAGFIAWARKWSAGLSSRATVDMINRANRTDEECRAKMLDGAHLGLTFAVSAAEETVLKTAPLLSPEISEAARVEARLYRRRQQDAKRRAKRGAKTQAEVTIRANAAMEAMQALNISKRTYHRWKNSGRLEAELEHRRNGTTEPPSVYETIIYTRLSAVRQ